jgi:hypothetical protein
MAEDGGGYASTKASVIIGYREIGLTARGTPFLIGADGNPAHAALVP